MNNIDNIQKFITKNELTKIGEGFDNLVFSDCSKRFIFRFPKKQDSLEHMQREALVLPLVQEAFREIIIPAPEFIEENEIYFGRYAYAAGMPLNNIIDSETRAFTIEHLGKFIKKLHTFQLNKSEQIPTINYAAKAADIYNDVQTNLFSTFTDAEKKYTHELFSSFLAHDSKTQTHCFLHGDISSEHIYIDSETKNITLIDWSDIMLADPAYEFHHLLRELNSKESELILNAYKADTMFRQRALFYRYMDIFVLLLLLDKRDDEKKFAEAKERLVNEIH